MSGTICDALMTPMPGEITFAAYLGNALRYDVEVASGVIFKVDIRDPWHHEVLPTGSMVTESRDMGGAPSLAFAAGAYRVCAGSRKKGARKSAAGAR